MRRAAAIFLAAITSAVAAPPEQVKEGRLLIYRNGCGQCHRLGPGAGAPDLSGLRERYPPSLLAGLIASPRSVKATSRMPHLFGPNPDEHKAEITALTHYLLSVPSKEPKPPPPLAGDATRGGKLYHEIGCAACHQPDTRELLPDSVPIAMATHYDREALVEYLLKPKTLLMPSLKLSRQEASDLAVWLQRDNQPRGHESPSLSRDLIQQGHDLYRTRRCVNCHGSPEAASDRESPPINIEDWTTGCLAQTSKIGVPHYAFTKLQRQAIKAAGQTAKPPDAHQHIDVTLTALRCYACHQRNGVGGPSDQRRPFFTVTEQMAESYGDFGNIPPRLDHVGRKLTRQWLRKILLEGHGEVRPYLATRMPHYTIPEAEVEILIGALESADQRDPPIRIDVSGLPGHQRGHYGRDLMGTKGLNCITCHGLKDQRALGAPSISLTHTVQRLRPAWFKELLLDPQSVQPGTLMPPLFLNRPKADQEVEQLWTYLKELDQRRLPDGLLRTGDYELKPAEAGKPIVFRTFLEGVGTHAIAVGYPEGTHLAFDSRTSQWALAWKGKFLNAMSTWDDRYATPAKPLSGDLYRFAPENRDRRFQGFRLDPNGVPVFLYTEMGVAVQDSISPDPAGRLQRTISKGLTTTRQSVHLHNHQASFHHEE